MLECTRCAALVRSRSRVVPGDGVVPAEIAFVGLAPGRFGGDRTGIPFSGDRSGALLRTDDQLVRDFATFSSRIWFAVIRAMMPAVIAIRIAMRSRIAAPILKRSSPQCIRESSCVSVGLRGASSPVAMRRSIRFVH